MSIAAETARDGARPPSRLSRLIKRHGRILPAFVFLALFFVLPVSMLLGLSFLDAEGGLSFEHYQRLWDKPVYMKVLGITLRTAAWTTFLCIAGGYPVAYLLATVAKTTRARLTIEGKLVTCLFAADGTDLRTPLRSGTSDAELRDLIESIWSRRTDRYSEQRAELTESRDPSTRKAKIEMYQIGG